MISWRGENLPLHSYALNQTRKETSPKIPQPGEKWCPRLSGAFPSPCPSTMPKCDGEAVYANKTKKNAIKFSPGTPRLDFPENAYLDPREKQ